jgi:hypothetical protein
LELSKIKDVVIFFKYFCAQNFQRNGGAHEFLYSHSYRMFAKYTAAYDFKRHIKIISLKSDKLIDDIK